MVKTEILSPAKSFKGYNFFTLIEKHKDGVIASVAGLVFLTLFVMMIASSTSYGPLLIVGEPTAAAGIVWTMLHGWMYWKNEQTK